MKQRVNRLALRALFLALLLLAGPLPLAAPGALGGVAARGVLDGGLTEHGRQAGGTDWISKLDQRRAAVILRKIDNARAACLMAGHSDNGTPQKSTLSRMLAVLERSALARSILRDMARQKVVICLDDTTRNFAYYLSQRRLVAVNARLNEAQKVVFLAHEMAHVPQHPTFSDDRRFSTDDLILLRRMREAAAEAVATRIAWQLRDAGYPQAWAAKLETVYGDIAQAFAASMRRSSAPGRSGPPPDTAAAIDRRQRLAVRAAFDQWFVKRLRLDVYDAMTLRHLGRIAGDRLGPLPTSRRLTHAFLRRLAESSGPGDLPRNREETRGQDLTGPGYRRALSAENLRRLEHILDRGSLRAVSRYTRSTPSDPS